MKKMVQIDVHIAQVKVVTAEGVETSQFGNQDQALMAVMRYREEGYETVAISGDVYVLEMEIEDDLEEIEVGF